MATADCLEPTIKTVEFELVMTSQGSKLEFKMI
jgi:hypothetical protein